MGHQHAAQALVNGVHALPDVSSQFAATQATYRFFNNPRISLPDLAEPLVKLARAEAPSVCDAYALVAHDWSHLAYPAHTEKKERVILSSNRIPEGYELSTALLIDDRKGCPVAPVAMSLRAADGTHCSRARQVRPSESPLDELLPTMDYLNKLNLGKPLVHIVDAEADSVGHYRQWDQHKHLFLVRADDRLVKHEGVEQRCSTLLDSLRGAGKLNQCREVRYHGRPVWQGCGEVPITLTRPAQRNRPNRGDRQRIPGPPLNLRLVFAEIRDAQGKLLAKWYLLTNVPADVDAPTICLWYYWRWSIESYFKLLKSGGMNLEQWQQTSPAAIARRLLVASMACALVWRLSRCEHPQAEPVRKLLTRLSGRQMKRGCTSTIPALLAGMWTFLAMLSLLETHTVEELKQYGQDLQQILHPP